MTSPFRPTERLKRRRRLREATITGTTGRPRLSVSGSHRGVALQLIDDASGRTIAAASSTEFALRDLPRLEQAQRVGELIAERAKEAGVDTAVLDRGAFRYQSRLQALAEGAREGGLLI